jgi:hypothetical protein
MSAFIVHPEHINVLIWAGQHHLRGGARLRWVFGNPTDLAELTAENATSVGRMLLEENTASVNHLHRKHHDINTSYTYHQPRHTGWSLPELLNALHCYQHQAGEHPSWETGQAHAFCQALQHRLIHLLPGYADAPWAITDTSVPAAHRQR